MSGPIASGAPSALTSPVLVLNDLVVDPNGLTPGGNNPAGLAYGFTGISVANNGQGNAEGNSSLIPGTPPVVPLSYGGLRVNTGLALAAAEGTARVLLIAGGPIVTAASGGTSLVFSTPGAGTNDGQATDEIIFSLGGTPGPPSTASATVLTLRGLGIGNFGNRGITIQQGFSASAADPQIQATGHGTNIGINLVTKGTGIVAVNGVAITPGSVSFPLSSAGDQTFQPSGIAASALTIHNNASAVNGLTITGTATGVAPIISAVGTDTNIGIVLAPKGTGTISSTANIVAPILDNGGAVVNVLSGGAVGNGITDDTAAITALLASNKTLYFPIGFTFQVSQLLLTTLSNITFTGGGTIRGSDRTQSVILATSPTNITFDHIRVGHQTPGARNGTAAIYMRQASVYLITGCEIFASAGAGTNIVASTSGRVIGNYVHDTMADGIHHNNHDSVFSGPTSHLTVAGNVCFNTGDDSISVIGYQTGGGGANTDIAITGNSIYQSHSDGINPSGCTGVTITSNLIDTTKASGIVLQQNGTFNTYGVTDCVVSGNTIVNANTYNFTSSANTTFTAAGGQDTNNPVWVVNQWVGLIVSCNAGANTGTITANTNSGGFTVNAWTGGTPANNSVFTIGITAGQAGILISSASAASPCTRITVTANQVYNAATTGIGVTGFAIGGVGSVVIRTNLVVGPSAQSATGIGIQASAAGFAGGVVFVEISNNVVDHASGSGISTDANVTTAIINGNTVNLPNQGNTAGQYGVRNQSTNPTSNFNVVIPDGGMAALTANVANTNASLATTAYALTITAGGLTVTAGGLTITAGALSVNATSGVTSAGTIIFQPTGVANNALQLVNVTAGGGAVNGLQVQGSATTAPIILSAVGTDTNIGITFTPKGTGFITFTTGTVSIAGTIQGTGTMNLQPSGQAVTALQIINNASAINGLSIHANATAVAPSLSAIGTDTNIGITITPKGTGTTTISAGGLSVTGVITIATGTKTTIITSGALSTQQFVSTTGAQVLTTRDVFLYTPVTFNPTAGAAATCVVAISPDNVTYTTLSTESIPAGVTFDGTIRSTSLWVPAAWYVKFTTVNAVLGLSVYW